MTIKPKQEFLDSVPIPALKPTKLSSEQEKERKDAIEALTKNRRAAAWQIHRWPLDKKYVEERTKIHLPRSYLAKDGEDVRLVRNGEDLNQLVYQWYFEPMEASAKSEGTVNFVAPDEIVPRRHEYLGPDPRVAGYFFDYNDEVHIRWWDDFLQEQWMDRQKWKMAVKLDDSGKWVEKED
ncbi:hypothetical protein JAAARDRAFT_617343 [Jaapia argillacea MUCL 33604]|uniref:Uncharacterized protein n=1 Tax=Jaapia argillacea MUCL 33604 TaxID=933084 RepID=A0A067P3Z8_9AGAM|nr:hypothetical protein JAAARDRAFT_617343 [Jaapia argillacea MUCL 33604]